MILKATQKVNLLGFLPLGSHLAILSLQKEHLGSLLTWVQSTPAQIIQVLTNFPCLVHASAVL